MVMRLEVDAQLLCKFQTNLLTSFGGLTKHSLSRWHLSSIIHQLCPLSVGITVL